MVSSALQSRATHWVIHGHDIHYNLDTAISYLAEKSEPVYELALQRQHENSRYSYCMHYVGCTEPSDMNMDCRTFASLDHNHSTRWLDPGPEPDDPIFSVVGVDMTKLQTDALKIMFSLEFG